MVADRFKTNAKRGECKRDIYIASSNVYQSLTHSLRADYKVKVKVVEL